MYALHWKGLLRSKTFNKCIPNIQDIYALYVYFLRIRSKTFNYKIDVSDDKAVKTSGVTAGLSGLSL